MRTLDGDAWLVGRVTMAETAKGEPHPPSDHAHVERQIHIANRGAERYAIAVDSSAKLHFRKAEINGDAVIVLLGSEVLDAHLAELASDGISYVVADDPQIDLVAALKRFAPSSGSSACGSRAAVQSTDRSSPRASSTS